MTTILPQRGSLQEDTYNKLRFTIPINSIKKEEIIPDNDQLIDYFKQIIGDDKFVIIDVGGYFSNILCELDKIFGDNLLGIIEDTENGLFKYINEINKINITGNVINFPIVSVARSPLKESEDYLVGKEISLKSEIYLSKKGISIFGKKVLVLGFGKIGRSAAVTFRERGSYVTVIDTDPIRQALALSYGFNCGNLSGELNISNLIICATGNHCIGMKDVNNIKNNKVYFFSVTSPDDEFEEYSHILKSGLIDEYDDLKIKTYENGEAIFVHNGLAINFQETKSILSNSIKLVLSEICEAICSLRSFPKGEISEISQERRKYLANYWLNDEMNVLAVGTIPFREI